jgi:hypothetical protein
MGGTTPHLDNTLVLAFPPLITPTHNHTTTHTPTEDYNRKVALGISLVSAFGDSAVAYTASAWRWQQHCGMHGWLLSSASMPTAPAVLPTSLGRWLLSEAGTPPTSSHCRSFQYACSRSCNACWALMHPLSLSLSLSLSLPALFTTHHSHPPPSLSLPPSLALFTYLQASKFPASPLTTGFMWMWAADFLHVLLCCPSPSHASKFCFTGEREGGWGLDSLIDSFTTCCWYPQGKGQQPALILHTPTLLHGC